MNIPNELMLDIFSYGGQRYTPQITDEELIERIQQHEPFFNYNVLKRKVALKNEFLNKYGQPKYEAVYDTVRNHKTTIWIYDNNLNINFNANMDAVENIREAIKALGYGLGSIEYKDYEDGGSTYMTISDPKALYRDLVSIWLLYDNQPRTISFTQSVGRASRADFRDLNATATVLHIPRTLPEYLRYAIGRNRENKRIAALKAYSLYQMLITHIWSLEPLYDGVSQYILRVFGVTSETQMAIGAELVRIMGVGNVLVDPDGFILKGTYKPELYEIDEFFHPYIVEHISVFR